MSRLSPVKPELLIKFLESLGFVKARQKGSHIFFRHKDGRTATIPFHKGEEIGRGLLLKILRDVEVSKKDFIKWLSGNKKGN
ncbi:YcfA family protein [Thermodesulfatator indicus DSM 15286]|uniref:YcfA family protein n=1 Tax=Thermodesulfatator indicus (strain DSM 15286 / JCM 11887 / CIR29812) TaxID=667014 RepID=F8AAU0_THEID|nr:type II toxin-antitoxin system HicA family toxin [Thermodesulfatator indicus]AEH45451.1 YcfA family protein [Thermodesulfatator indicus DSM 15286]